MKAFFVILIVVISIQANAQDTPKKSLFFEPGAKQPAVSPSSTPANKQTPKTFHWTQDHTTTDSPAAATSTPKKIYHSKKSDPLDAAVDVFYLALQAGDIGTAYDTLVAQSPVADDPAQVADLKKKTAAALEAYGPITDYELISQQSVGKNLVRRTYLSHGDTQPLRWRFYFYRIKDQWRLVDFRVDDGLLEFFENDTTSRR